MSPTLLLTWPTRKAIFSVVAGVAMLLSAGTPTADGHGGVQVYYDEVGPYLVQAFTSVAAGQGTDHLDYSVSLRNANTLSPVDDAKVTVTATMSGRAPEFFTAKRYVSTYDVLLPLEKQGGEWQAAFLTGDVAMQVSITGPLGDAIFEHSLTPAAVNISGGDTQGLSGTLVLGLIGLSFGVLAVGAWLLLKRPVAQQPFRRARRNRHG